MVVGQFSKSAKTVVIGSGPGGYVAAIRAAQLGQEVMIIERDEIGGVCLNSGCIPSKALIHASSLYAKSKHVSKLGLSFPNATIDWKQTLTWKNNDVVKTLTQGVNSLLRKNKVQIVKGEAHFVSNDKLHVILDEYNGDNYTFENVIIATGSRPIEIPGFKFSKRVLDSTAALNLQEIPKSMVIVGGGYIGSELAGVFANLGVKVTILEGAASILPNFETDLSDVVVKSMKKQGVDIFTKVKAKSAEESTNDVKVTYEEDGKEKTITVDYVLVTVGRKPNTDKLGLEYTDVEMDQKGLIKIDDQGRTTVKNIYAIGDVVPGLALAHKASYEAKVVAEAVMGKPTGFDYSVIPAVCFTHPEIATVGLSKKDVAENNEYKQVKFPLHGNGRALSMDDNEGFIRLIFDRNDHSVLGAEVVGPSASEIIGELTMAIESQLTIEDISMIIHPHPTVSEIILDSAELAKGLGIHI